MAARKRLDGQCVSWRKQRERAYQQMRRAEQVIAKHRQKIQSLETERESLRAWLAQLETDNASNPDAPACLWRMDAGFGSGENIAWLIEMGYAVETKSPNAKTFAPSSALPEVVLYLSGQHAYQPALPFNRPLEFSSE